MRTAKAPRVTSCFAYLSLPPSALQPGARGFHVSVNSWDKLAFPFCYRYFSSHVTRGRLPPFDPCGPWVAKDRLRPLFPSLGSVLALGALLRYSLRRGSSFPVFQQVLSGDLGTPFSPQWVGDWTAGATRGFGRFRGASPEPLERVRWAGWEPPGYELGVNCLFAREGILPGFLGPPSENSKSAF